MNIQPFLIYVIAFAGGSIGLMAVVKSISSGFGRFGKKPWIYNFASSGSISIAAFGISYVVEDPLAIFGILSAICLLAGIIFVAWAGKKYFKATSNNRNQQFVAELLYAISIVLAGLVIFIILHHFLKGKNFLYFPILCSMIFYLIPIFLWHTFKAAYAIPLPLYPFWQYPINDTIPLPEENENERLVVLGFEIAKQSGETTTYFRAKAPEDILLGDLFYHFINDYNEQQSETPIIFLNEFKEGYTWAFRTKGAWNKSSKFLDSNKSIKENKIKENTVIICERINSQ